MGKAEFIAVLAMLLYRTIKNRRQEALPVIHDRRKGQVKQRFRESLENHLKAIKEQQELAEKLLKK